jgi:hypothetical protein
MISFVTIALSFVLVAPAAWAAPKFRPRAWDRDRAVLADELRAIATVNPALPTEARAALVPAVEHVVRLNQRVREYPEDLRRSIFGHVVGGAFDDADALSTSTLRRIAGDLSRETGREPGMLGDSIARASIRRATILNYVVNAIAGTSVIVVAAYELYFAGPAIGPFAMMPRYAEILATSLAGFVALEYLPDLDLLHINEVPSILRECERRFVTSDDGAIEGPST